MRKIVHSSLTCGGSPRIDGTRLTCGNVVELLTGALPSLNSFFAIHDYLTLADIEASLMYCARKQCADDEVESFCQGCILDQDTIEPTATIISSEDDGVDFFEEEERTALWEDANRLLEILKFSD